MVETFPKHNLAVQLIYAFNRFIAARDVCLGADLWQAESRELSGQCHPWPPCPHVLVPTPLWLLTSQLDPSPAAPEQYGEEEKYHQREIKSRSLTLTS